MKGDKNCMNKKMMDAVKFMNERTQEEDVNELFTILLNQKEVTDSTIKWLKFCMHAGADVTLLDSEVLIKASGIDDNELLSMALKGADPNARNGLAMLTALKHHLTENMQHLYNNGAKITEDVIKAIIKTQDVESFMMIDELGININDIYPRAIPEVAEYGNTVMFKRLLEKDRKYNADYSNALYYSSVKGHYDIVEMILPLDKISTADRTNALAGAISRRQEKLLPLFEQFKECLLPSHLKIAAQYGSFEMFNTLLSWGLDATYCCKDYKTMQTVTSQMSSDSSDSNPYRKIYRILMDLQTKN